MRDLLVCVPSRGRPERLRAMWQAALSLSQAVTDIAVALDTDDPSLRLGYQPGLVESERVFKWCYVRDTVSALTNELATWGAGKYRALCSMSDDHLPRTPGWDRLLLDAIGAMGGTGIAYGDDLLQGERTCTAAVVSADIVQALGWLAEPSMRHYHIDDVWRELGRGAGCLAYVPEVVIEHCHPNAGKAAVDETYSSESALDHLDDEPWRRWLAERKDADVATVRALMDGKAGS